MNLSNNPENTLLEQLKHSRDELQNSMRVPQSPIEHERAQKMLIAIDSAIAIVNKTKMTALSQQS